MKSTKELTYILNHLDHLDNKKISNPCVISNDLIENEQNPYHKINYLIQNLRFDDATKQLPNLSNQLIDSMKYQISNAQDFYTTYKIPYNDHNKQIVDELSNKYKTHMLNTTPCRHDKTGQTMRISCWKCN